ncbi:MAG: leucine-rich repeat domain-containing protein [Clostridia bacterium]|nr:leucine-rich repeat domain-containing protein [Clostridia bacterium]
MKRLLKIFSLALALIMLFSCLVSCGVIDQILASPEDALEGEELENEDLANEEQEAQKDKPSTPNNTTANNGGDGGFKLSEKVISDETIFTEGVFKYAVYDDETAIITEHTGGETEIVVPDTLGGYPVVAIGAGAFYENEVATSVKFGASLEIIGASAFGECIELKNVEIPKTVWAIYPDAFTGTPWYESLIKDEFVIVGDSVLLKYNGTDSTVVIPDTVKHLSAAFMGNETIKDVTIPDSVYTIGAAAFSSSSVSRVMLGNNVLMLDDSAFAYCYELHYINMPDSLKVIGSNAFISCTGLNYLKLGKNVETIGTYAFYRASQFSYIYIPKSIKTIEPMAFEDCNYLNYIYYEGSQEEFDALGVSTNNPKLLEVKIFYNYDYSGGIYEAQQ